MDRLNIYTSLMEEYESASLNTDPESPDANNFIIEPLLKIKESIESSYKNNPDIYTEAPNILQILSGLINGEFENQTQLNFLLLSLGFSIGFSASNFYQFENTLLHNHDVTKLTKHHRGLNNHNQIREKYHQLYKRISDTRWRQSKYKNLNYTSMARLVFTEAVQELWCNQNLTAEEISHIEKYILPENYKGLIRWIRSSAPISVSQRAGAPTKEEQSLIKPIKSEYTKVLKALNEKRNLP